MVESSYWKRFNKRVSRRTLLGGSAALALGAASAALVGCNGGTNGNGGNGDTSGAPSPAAAGTPRLGGHITLGRGVASLGIDPHVDLTGLDIDALVYSYLYSWRTGTEEIVLNNLAEKFEQPDEEHLEFIFTLRPGVKIHPGGPGAGEEMTSEDCVASFERRGTALTAPDKRFPHRIERYETPDPYTFKFVMKRPFVPAVREMANATWAIVPKKVIDANPNGLSQVAFGSGPFKLEEFRGQEKIVLRKHEDYFLKPRPWLDSMTNIVITENSSLLAAFKGGQHDVNGALLSKSNADDLKSDDNFIIIRTPSFFYPVIHLKMREPFENIKVREAINLALNRDEIINVIQQGEGEYNPPIQWAQTKWALPQAEVRAFYKHDPDRARALLAEADLPNGFSAKMKLPKLTGPSIVGDIAALVKDQLGRVGINIELDEVELGAFISSTLLPGNFHMAFFPNLPYDEPDRPLAFYHSKGVTGNGNWTNYSNKELDQLVDEQSEEFDEVKRKDIILKAQRLILAQHGPQLTLTGGYNYQARWNYVHFGTELTGEEPPKDAGPFGADIWVDK